MRVFNDFLCTNCGITEEHFLENDCKQTTCLVCGAPARKILRPISFQLEGQSGHFPTASDQWVKKREQKMALERKSNPES